VENGNLKHKTKFCRFQNDPAPDPRFLIAQHPLHELCWFDSIKKIIDLISGAVPNDILRDQLFHYIFLVTVAVFVYQILYRIGDYLISYYEANVIREIHNDTFARLMNHSYKFFSNNFSGSLVSKSKRFAASFERITDIISFQLWFTLVHLTGVLTVLFLKAPQIGFVFLGWAIFYIFITILFIQKKITYDLIEAEADSKVTGRFADAFTNILNIKIFSGREREMVSFKEVTFDESKKRLKSWIFGNLQNTIQGLLMAVLQIIILY
jgi:ABC-type multidrug transport system fused ATPase/permease subunit